MRAGAVVVAAGTGSRFGGTEAPKQFLPLAGRPLAVRAVEALLGHPAIERVVLVLPASGFENWREQVAPFLSGAGSRILFRPGGTTRQESATLGLEALDEARSQADAGASLQPPDLVLVHDGARPAVPASLVARVIEAARSHGAAIPAVPPLDTLWRLDSDGCADRLVDRERTAAAQTPQCFRRDILRDALSRAAAAGFVGTDEASAVRWAGHPVRIVSGSRRNLKITEPADLELIRGLFGENPGPPRIGFGFDAHRFGEEGTLCLAGVRFEGVAALAGHSDGDALLHALADAILGAVAAPDLGALFPSSDEALRGAASRRFVERALEIAAGAGYRPGQVDCTVIAERPRLAPRVAEIRSALGKLLGIPASAVGVKATTTDGMGFTGRGEGLAAKALVRLDPLPAASSGCA